MGTSGSNNYWRGLKYLSLRMVEERLQRATTSPRPKMSFNVGVPLPGLNGATAGVGIEWESSHKPSAVDIIVSLDRTLRGTYIDFGAPVDPMTVNPGELVRATMLFQHAHMQIQNYDLVHPMREPYYVVGYTSIDHVPGIGRVFVGLVGSRHNLLSMPGDGTIGAGHAASTAQGLYEMIQYTKETLYGEDIDQYTMERDLVRYESATAAQRLQVAASSFKGYDIQSVPRPAEVFFEVHHVARDVELETLVRGMDGGGRVDMAIMGALIWIREATDREQSSLSDVILGVGAIEARWERFDEELRTHIHNKRFVTDWRPGSEEEWLHFGRWAAAWATRVGPSTEWLYWNPPTRRFFGMLKGPPAAEPVPSEVWGWLVHNWDYGVFLLSPGGNLFEAVKRIRHHHPGITLRPIDFDVSLARTPGEAASLAWDDKASADAAADVFLSITRWLLPFAERRG